MKAEGFFFWKTQRPSDVIRLHDVHLVKHWSKNKKLNLKDRFVPRGHKCDCVF